MRKAKTSKSRAVAPRAAANPVAAAYAEPGASRRTLKTSEVVALDIVRDIVARELKPGDKLPLEAEMLRQYRVSRSSLREALRLLEVQSLITIRPGPGGGAMVGRVHPGSLGRTLTLHLHLLGATYDELLDTWVMTEVVLAGMAAKNPDRERVRAALTPFLDNHGGSDHATHAIDEGLQFHQVVAELADNRVLSYLLRSAGSIVTEHIVTNVDRKALEDHIVHEHSALAKAIIAGNANKAEQIMRDHIHHVAEYFRAYWPRKIGEKIQWR